MYMGASFSLALRSVFQNFDFDNNPEHTHTAVHYKYG